MNVAAGAEMDRCHNWDVLAERNDLAPHAGRRASDVEVEDNGLTPLAGRSADTPKLVYTPR